MRTYSTVPVPRRSIYELGVIMKSATQDVSMLIVDDDEVCQMLVERAVGDCARPFKLVAARDGVEALEILQYDGHAPRIRRPFVILLDLRMPRMDGIEFLKVLRNDPVLRDAIVFVLTTSEQDCDIKSAYQLNVAGYLVKPPNYSLFKDMIIMLEQYCSLVVLPCG